ncbi:hypothetical protein PAXRUDRAFT_830609 [Paxillus rubicundulus Ve08.2h10]|uniref:DNA replication checkpoint mediator MRC1 domain-containing protein n=1 Tax=Paxillus rubicundulus Ve08.2h10 TaxID=930991 RepID=A0A0D0DT77_9AGAM|nr:hypothetical protein PAXRUDRAFT_830609 [Paxillus rubicundulus Ve08.2h10]
MSTKDETANNTSQSSPQPIKRSTFVYGKRRSLLVDQHDVAGVASVLGSRNEQTLLHEYKDACPDHLVGLEGQRASPSPSAHSSEDGANGPDAALDFEFDFRRRMKELDKRFDDDEGPIALPRLSKSLPSPSLPLEQSDTADLSSMKDIQSVAEGTMPLSRDAGHSSGNPFGGSLSPLSGSLPVPSSQEQSPTVRRPAKGVAKQVFASDSEAGEPGNSSPVSPIRHSITTPHLRSPPTPPTSEAEMPPTKRSEKARGKVPARDVPPLRFNSEDPSTSTVPRMFNKGKGRESSARTKTKAPTKKERREAALESTRIAASRPVEIVRTQEPKHTLSSFFANLQRGKITTPIPRTELKSDPIEKFSSPTDVTKNTTPVENVFGVPTGLLAFLGPDIPRGTSKRLPPPANIVAYPAAADSSDDEMPELNRVLQQEQRKRQTDEKQQRLQEVKLAALRQGYSSKASDGEDDDLLIVKDDMHTIARKEAVQRRLDKANGSPAKAKAKVLAMGHRSVPRTSSARSGLLARPKFSEQNLREFAKPSFVRTGKDGKDLLSKKQLDRMMMMQHEQEKLRTIQQHEEEWIQKGGRLSRGDGADNGQTSLSQTVGACAEQGLKAADNGDATTGEHEEGSTDNSDEDYSPGLRGSASPEPMDANEDVSSDQGDEMEVLPNSEPPTDDENGNAVPLKRKFGLRRPPRVVLGSDDDEEEHLNHRVSMPDSSTVDIELGARAVTGHRNSTSSTESQTEDENDKENTVKLMYDRSEDKENKAVVRHSPSLPRSAFGLRPGFLRGVDDGVQSSLNLSSMADTNGAAASPKEMVRSPLKDISKEDDDPFLLSPPSKDPFTERLLQSVVASPPHPSASKLGLGSPVLRSERTGHLSQLSFDSENDENVASGFKAPVLQPSFLDKLNSQANLVPSLAALNPLPSDGFSQLFPDEDKSSKKSVGRTENDELALTLDVGLKPALKVSGTLLRRADDIFEKEQEYVVAAAVQTSDRPKEILYVDDHGFLTQTRPELASPQVYRMTPSQASKFVGTQVRSTQAAELPSERRPLRTLSFVATQELSPEPRPLRRLRKRSASPIEPKIRACKTSPTATLLPLAAGSPKPNAFDILGKPLKPTSKTYNGKLQSSEFVAAEAQESDEDDMFGFGVAKEDDEEDEDDDDQDKVVEGLVDDAFMDAETEAVDLVQEKHREHEEEDDQQVQKLHQDAIEGRLRMKRRDRGVGFQDDSDDDEDDDEARRIRQRMYKKRKIEDDDLEALGQNENTRAFYNTYHQDLVDEDDEFKHLREDVIMGEDDTQADDPEERGTVSVDEVRQRLREVAHDNTVVEVLDSKDTSWIDQLMTNEDDDMAQVKVMQHRPNKTTARRPNPGHVDFDGERPKQHAESEQQRKQMLSWAKGQSHRYQGTGRSGNGAAVTAHTKVKSGGGSLRSARPSSLGGMSESRNTASKASSMLSTVSDRSGRFA